MTRPPETLPEPLREKLHLPLLRLHAALELETLWAATRELLRTAFSVHRITLFLGHVGNGEARWVRTDPPIEHSNDWYSARGKLNPFSPFIDANLGLKWYRFSDVLPPRRDFIRTEFYRRFAQPEGWDKGVTAMFWDGSEIRAMFSLYKGVRQPDVSPLDMAVLGYLYPYVETAIVRVQRIHSERSARRSFEEFANEIPIGFLILDWELKVEYSNSEGHRACASWNFGLEGARRFNPREAFHVPEAIKNRCAELRSRRLELDPKQWAASGAAVVRVAHHDVPAWSAQVSLIGSHSSALAKPRFLVILDTPLATSRSLKPEGKVAQLRNLTPSEREIAHWVCEGLSNLEIAERLSKSVLTVKTQLNAVFRKTGAKSRAKLTLMLR